MHHDNDLHHTHKKMQHRRQKRRKHKRKINKLQQQIKQKDAQTCNNTQLQKEEETQPCKLYINDALKRKKSSKDHKRKKMGTIHYSYVTCT